MKTASELVEHVKMALRQQWGYVHGTYGTCLTEKFLGQLVTQYPAQVGSRVAVIRSKNLGKMVTDCVGLIKSCFWWNPLLKAAVYDARSDRSANGSYTAATKKGPIGSMTKKPGICVWRNGHIGVFIGNDTVVEAKGLMYGVVATPLSGTGSNGWTHWLEYPGIDYSEPTPLPDWKTLLIRYSTNPSMWWAMADETDGRKHIPELIKKMYEAGYNAGRRGE